MSVVLDVGDVSKHNLLYTECVERPLVRVCRSCEVGVQLALSHIWPNHVDANVWYQEQRDDLSHIIEHFCDFVDEWPKVRRG